MLTAPLTTITEDRPSPVSRTLLRFLTCGSVDDGKSTLIGRLLHDTQFIPDDQWSILERDSRRYGTTGEDLDLALLVDGLEAEREQGITIDVAYRFFRSSARSFIVADTPGHEQYTRNMVTGASHCDAGVILLDARKGVLTQTRRHSYICSLLGIRHVALAVNKMDLVDGSQKRFDNVAAEYMDFASKLGFTSVTAIPLSARFGDNVTISSSRLEWFVGPTLLAWLENVSTDDADEQKSFRFPVQWVNRPDQSFRGYAGTVWGGRIHKGDQVAVSHTGVRTTIDRIVTADGEQDTAGAGDAVTLVLRDDTDLTRGDVLADPASVPQVADQFAAELIWMSEEPMLPGRTYLFRAGNLITPGRVTMLKHVTDVNTLLQLSASRLSLNEVGHCQIATNRPIVIDPYLENRRMGSFIVIDRTTNATVGAGLIRFALRRAANLQWQNTTVTRTTRTALNGHAAAVVWFTGLSGSGKSTIADLVERDLHSAGVRTYLLDGDNVRHALNKDLGFTSEDRVENIRRVGEVAKLFADAGLVVLCSFISPFRAERQMVRELLEDEEFLEVFVDAPFDECARRDPKGLYARVTAGLVKNFTGLDSPYEVPERPDIRLDTTSTSALACAQAVVGELRRRKVF